MFQLKKHHQDSFQNKAEADFVSEVIDYLRENHADTVVKLPNGEFKVVDLTEETLRRMVNNGIIQAKKHGLERRRYLISYIVLMFVSAPNFDKYEKISNVLNSCLKISEIYFNDIFQRTNDADWLEIYNQYNFNSWCL